MNARKLIFQSIILLFFFLPVYPQTKEQLQREKRKIEQEIAYTNRLLNETRQTTETTMGQLVLINNQIQQRERLIRNINTEINNLNNRIDANNKAIENLEKELEELKNQYAKMIYYAYKNRSAYNRLMFIFSAQNFNQAYRRMRYMQQYTAYRQKQAKQIVETQAELERRSEELEIQLADRRTLLNSQNQERRALSQEQNEKSQTVESLRQRAQNLTAQIRRKEAAAEELQNAIEKIIAEEIRRAAERAREAEPTTKFKLTPEEMTLSRNFAANKGKLPWPLVRAVVSSRFGKNPHPILPGIIVNNKGVDMVTTPGAKARAVFDGTVIRVIEMPMYRNVVIVSHGEYFSVYSKLDRVLVRQGDNLTTLQDIGVVYTDNNESKTELHFEIWQGNEFIDPLEWLAK